MKKIHSIHTFEQIKILADERRIEILRLLMGEPATLSQLAKQLGQSAAWVRHHTEKLLAAELIELDRIVKTCKVSEKYYRAKAGAFILQELVLPKSEKPVIIFSGSHDLVLENIANTLGEHITILSMPVGSLNGLVNLRQGLCQVSGAHLLADNGEYNTPFVRHFFPDKAMDVVTLTHRTQGLIVSPGNPLNVTGVADLPRTGLRFINRNPGSGTRIWFDSELKHLGISPESIRGYDQTLNTHTACAQKILQGQADAALGLQASAIQHGLDFIPLFEERYDLILPRSHETILAPLLDHIQTSGFRKNVATLTGYSTTKSGEQITI
jgi:putative molybdopterin biosynthesis protein